MYTNSVILCIFYEISESDDDQMVSSILTKQGSNLDIVIPEFTTTQFSIYYGSETYPDCTEDLTYVLLPEYKRKIPQS